MDTLALQIEYDTKLDNSTYDAIKAFQLNTINSSTSDLTNSKIRDIEAAANSFFTSIASSFNMTGYNSDNLKEYVPALVFTLYDGFYIYSPFENTLDEETRNSLKPNATYTNGEEVTGLKPYIYYSCRYVNGQMDVVITYSLDNYITIQGYDQNGKAINDAGYLIDDISYNSSTGSITYRGVNITSEPQLTEYIGNKRYPYIKINGVKYYEDDDGTWFTILNGKKNSGQGPFKNENNDMGYQYYKEAYEFRKRVESYGLTNLTSANAVGVEDVKDENGDVIYSFVDGNYKIFDFDGIEEPDSNFNQHRLAVIRYVVESNLSIALANYNNYGTGSYEFRMPKLAEEDWEKILNNVSLISFLQGLSIGGKIYNGYSVINNNKNEEVVTENSIYIVENINDNNSTYHRVTHENLAVNANSMGVFNIDLERKSLGSTSSEETYYYYPHKQLGCYTCYITQTDAVGTSNIYQYLDDHKDLAKVYYTALGRERYSMYKVFRNPSEATETYKEVAKSNKKILLFGVSDSGRGSNLARLQTNLLEKYTTVKLETTTRSNVSQYINNVIMDEANDYDLVICDAYVWPTGDIADQSILNYHLITISDDANKNDNNLIEESTQVTTANIESVAVQSGALQGMTINAVNEGETNSSITKVKFKSGVGVLATAKYFGDSDTYDLIGYTTIGSHKQIHSQAVLSNDYLEVVERLVDFVFK